MGWMAFVILGVIALVFVGGIWYYQASQDEKVVEQKQGNASLLDVPEVEIVDVLPADRIPAIDEPKFIAPDEADFLKDDYLGILVKVQDDIRFYPYNILNWHEIVNDEIAGRALSVTYCPLCATGIVFEREILGKVYDFGTSGKLYQSNLVMYDRQTKSLWSQVLGGAISGEMKGTLLRIYPSSILEFGEAKRLYPDIKILSTDTGYRRDYDFYPYGDYETSEEIYFPVNHKDQRLHPKEMMYGLSVDGVFKAYHYNNLLKKSSLEDEVNGHLLKITVNEDKEIVVFDETSGERVYGFNVFWFSWVAVHPEGEVWVE